MPQQCFNRCSRFIFFAFRLQASHQHQCVDNVFFAFSWNLINLITMKKEAHVVGNFNAFFSTLNCNESLYAKYEYFKLTCCNEVSRKKNAKLFCEIFPTDSSLLGFFFFTICSRHICHDDWVENMWICLFGTMYDLYNLETTKKQTVLGKIRSRRKKRKCKQIFRFVCI